MFPVSLGEASAWVLLCSPHSLGGPCCGLPAEHSGRVTVPGRPVFAVSLAGLTFLSTTNSFSAAVRLLISSSYLRGRIGWDAEPRGSVPAPERPAHDASSVSNTSPSSPCTSFFIFALILLSHYFALSFLPAGLVQQFQPVHTGIGVWSETAVNRAKPPERPSPVPGWRTRLLFPAPLPRLVFFCSIQDSAQRLWGNWPKCPGGGQELEQPLKLAGAMGRKVNA